MSPEIIVFYKDCNQPYGFTKLGESWDKYKRYNDQWEFNDNICNNTMIRDIKQADTVYITCKTLKDILCEQ